MVSEMEQRKCDETQPSKDIEEDETLQMIVNGVTILQRTYYSEFIKKRCDVWSIRACKETTGTMTQD